MYKPRGINQTFTYGHPSGNWEAMKEIINHTVQERYLQDKKLQEDSVKKVRKLIFKDAQPTKSLGYWLKALENFKKVYEEHHQ